MKRTPLRKIFVKLLFLDIGIEDFLIFAVLLKIGKALVKHVEQLGVLAFINREAVGRALFLLRDNLQTDVL